ncbi:ComF family protein [Paenibacillus sp. BSR1-1]|uniref:ComF family protein n=1 Tax=Paenibacillus sp. BSR1-1 TaxID=3020845 RepID=UPI0025B0A2FE|nr:ComF family protein [Paenibacillus sp. BSR1-1]MDN3019026.1 ComF family protein [Paenibacillus sp. BSR1-1]
MNLFLQDRCLICHELIRPSISWRAMISVEKEHSICTACESKLEKIEGETCHICCRPFIYLDEKFRHGNLCNDCTRWEEDPEWQGFLDKNISLFLYNDFLKEVLAKFKYRGDYALVKVFSELMKDKLIKMEPDLFVPIPLSDERLYERGFNQAKAILLVSGFTPSEIITRIHTEKQSKKSRSERIHLPQVFKLCQDLNLKDKNIVIIDDIYTTGSTLRHAARLLKGAGAAAIQSLTIAR